MLPGIYMCVIYYRRNSLKSKHNIVHLNLSIALLIGLILFVSGIENSTGSEVSCYSYCIIEWCFVVQRSSPNIDMHYILSILIYLGTKSMLMYCAGPGLLCPKFYLLCF